jgi:FKBP-type peptidyl-prolyl cis-trans isomerase SlyD
MVLALGLALGVAEAQAQEPAPVEAQPKSGTQPADAATTPAVQDGAKVQLEYTLSDGAGTVLDTNKDKEPITYTQGSRQIIPGLEKALDGMRAGDEKKVTLEPAEAYGEVNPGAVAEVPREQLPPDPLQVGMQLIAEGQAGRRIVRIKEIKENTVVLDLNHPLAGKTLSFDVKVIRVELPGK